MGVKGLCESKSKLLFFFECGRVKPLYRKWFGGGGSIMRGKSSDYGEMPGLKWERGEGLEICQEVFPG